MLVFSMDDPEKEFVDLTKDYTNFINVNVLDAADATKSGDSKAAAEALVAYQNKAVRQHRHLLAVLAYVLLFCIIHQTPAIYVFHT